MPRRNAALFLSPDAVIREMTRCKKNWLTGSFRRLNHHPKRVKFILAGDDDDVLG